MLEHGERWDGTDLKLLSQLRQLFGVHFGDQPLSGAGGGNPFEFGRNRFTGPTPRSPEIYQHSDVGSRDQRVECGAVRNFNWFCGWWERRLALAAAARLPEALIGQSIALAAMSTGNHEPANIGFDGYLSAHSVLGLNFET